jgi:SAM-dependent methyltransferase
LSSDAHLERLAAIVQCLACGGACGRLPEKETGLTCTSCGVFSPFRDTVLVVAAPHERAEVTAERAAVTATERNAALGGINDAFDDLAHAEGPLRDAILALPEGDESKYYREPGYFLNVARSLRGFHFACDRLQPRPGQRLLDVGADLTWSTNVFARAGLRCTALDVNDHLAVGGIFQAKYGAAYDMVRADMNAPVFRDESFDLVVAFNALHHSGQLDRVAANLARVLVPGGRLAAVEPYCLDAVRQQEFGRAQIEAGINEHTYLLDEWHTAFSRAGLALEEVMVADACNMIYRKPLPGEQRSLQPAMLDRSYAGRLAVSVTDLPADSRGAVGIAVGITNTGNATWCSEGAVPVFASYHLERRDHGRWTLVAFDNRRTPLPDVRPGATAASVVVVDVPGAPGDYRVVLDLVHEGICWFAHKGFEGDQLEFRVGPDGRVGRVIG